MPDTNYPVHSAVVVTHPNKPESQTEAGLITTFLQDHGLLAANGMVYDTQLRQRVQEHEFDLIIALGGDGTMLRAAHLGGPCNIPVLGINMGHLGFLMEVPPGQWRGVLVNLLDGSFWLENRMMLCAQLWRGSEKLQSWDVINEVVVSRGNVVRPVHLITSIDGRYLTTYVADALIAATATGSTAYSLAAGGPILPPELRNILIVPVAPHLSLDRAIVLPEGTTVSIMVDTDHQAVISVDGQTPVELEDGDRVDAFADDFTVKFVRFQDPGYFYRNLVPHMNNQNTSNGTNR